MAIFYSRDLINWEENIKVSSRKKSDGKHIIVNSCTSNKLLYVSFNVPLGVANELTKTGYIDIRYYAPCNNFYIKEVVSQYGYRLSKISKSSAYLRIPVRNLHIDPKDIGKIIGAYRVERCDADVFGMEKVGD